VFKPEMGELDFFMPARMLFGWGKVREVATWARTWGTRGLLVTMADIPHGERVRALLQEGGIDVVVYDRCEPEPSIEGIDAAWKELAQDYDCIVAVGGGSVMDTAKAFAVLHAGGGSAWEYTVEMGDDRRPVPSPLVPLIAVPTTAGTGSEVTYNAVLTNKRLREKAPIRDAALCPRIALIDPELTLSMPPLLTASTGFDAFTHAYERFFGTAELSAYIHQLSVMGMKMVIDNLETAVREPRNREARTALSWAATQNGMVVVAAGGEAALHVFGLPIGAVAHVPHGQALAIMTAAITRRHVRTKPHRARELAGLFGLDTAGLGGEELERALVSALSDWMHRVKLRTTLGEHGIAADQIPQFMQAISRTRLAAVFGPGFDEGDIREAYQESL
jgi:alcohol dehydrogenase class IV